MSACPHCHIYKGMWSPLSRKKDGTYICQTNSKHRFKRDKEGNYHSTL